MKLPAASCGVSKRNCDEAEPPSLCDLGHPQFILQQAAGYVAKANQKNDCTEIHEALDSPENTCYHNCLECQGCWFNTSLRKKPLQAILLIKFFIRLIRESKIL